MTGTAPTMTERQRFQLFATTRTDAAAILATAEETRTPLNYGVFADWLDEQGETEWAAVFRACLGEEWSISLDGSTYHVRAVSGAKPGKTVYMVNRHSPRMRSTFGDIDYAHSAAELVSYFAAIRERANAKADRKAKESAAKAAARKQPNPYQVGDLLHYSYGYDATINHFAQVVAVSSQSVTVRPIRAEQVGEGWATGCKVRPVPGCFCGDPETTRLAYSAWGDTASVSLPVHDHKGKHWRKINAGYETYETDNR